mgnify:CR=1 FL=1
MIVSFRLQTDPQTDQYAYPFGLSHFTAKLAMEVVDNCSVRIKGVATERYLAMGINGTLVSQVRISDEKYHYLSRFGSDSIRNYCLLTNLVMVFLLCNQI